MSGYSNSNIESLSVQDPDSLLWVQPHRCPDQHRELLILRPQSNTYSTNGDNCIRFVLPKQNIDPRRNFLKFNVTITTTGGTYKRLPQGAFSVIDRIRWFNGEVEEQYEYYNRIQNLVMNSQVNAEVIETIGQDFLGYGTQADRNASGAVTTEYVIPINVGIFQCPVLPLGEIGKVNDFNVELWLANPLGVVETDGANPIITIDNIRWHYYKVWSDDMSYERSLRASIASGKMKIGYDAYACFQTPVLNTLNDLQITWRGNSLKSIATILVDQSTVNSVTTPDKFTTWPKTLSNGASVYSYQSQLKDGLWQPVEPVACSGDAPEAYAIYLNNNGLWDMNALTMFPAPIDQDSFNLDQFIMINDYSSVPEQNHADEPNTAPFFFNNLSTLKQSQNTLFRLTLTAAPPEQTVAYHFVKYGSLLSIAANGVLTRHL